MGGQKTLLVEGIDDLHVILAIQGQRNIRLLDKKEILSQDGIEPLLTAFPVYLKASNIEMLGVVVDADTNLDGRWRSLRDRLIQAGFDEVPEQPIEHGTVILPPAGSLLPRVGIWLMPNNATTGILEDFLRFLVPADCPLFQHAVNSVENIPKSRLLFTEFAKPKVLIHTWLAWQEEPGRPLGQSITARFLDHRVPQVDQFVAWLHKLYV